MTWKVQYWTQSGQKVEGSFGARSDLLKCINRLILREDVKRFQVEKVG